MSHRNALTHALRDLVDAGGFFVNPTPAAIKKFAPHLELPEVDELFTEANDVGRVQFIGPPLKINGAEHLYHLTKFTDPEDHQEKLKFSWGGCHRRKESYACTSRPPEWKSHDFDYRERVSNFASIHWGESLQWDHAKQHIVIHLVDPTRRTKHHSPVVTQQCMITLTEQWIDLEPRQDRYPWPQLIEQTLDLISLNYFVNAELVGPGMPMAAYNCSFCGGGLGLDACYFCNRKVVCKKAARADWTIPIPTRVCDELQWMASFEQSPVNAIKAYYAKWAAIDYQAPVRPREIREARSIVLREEPE